MLEGERLVLTEYIHEGQGQPRRVGLPPLLHRWQHRLTHQVGVALRVIFEFRRDRVRSQECDRQVHRRLIVERKQRLQQAQLSGCLQTVAGLRLRRCGAVCEHPQQARACLGD